MEDIQISYLAYSHNALPDFVQTVFAIGHDLPKSGLVPANIGFDGVVYVGAKGDLHFSIAEKHPEGAPFQGLGFVTPAGRYLDRSQALEWVRKHEGPVKSSLNMQGELDALDYREQVFFRPDLGG